MKIAINTNIRNAQLTQSGPHKFVAKNTYNDTEAVTNEEIEYVLVPRPRIYIYNVLEL